MAGRGLARRPSRIPPPAGPLEQGLHRGRPIRRRKQGSGPLGTFVLLTFMAVVAVAGYILLPPILHTKAIELAEQNPDWLRFGFVETAVEEEIGTRADLPGGSDPAPIEFSVASGTGSREVAEELVKRSILADRLAFYYALRESYAGRIQVGSHTLSQTMSPRQIVAELQRPPPPPVARTAIALRPGLRLEQVVAYLQTLDDLMLDVAEFHSLARRPPVELREEYQWLQALPVGRTLEGFLGSGTFEVEREISAIDLLRRLLDRWQASGAPELLTLAQEQEMDPYELIILASIIEREASRDDERALIAGVYANRLTGLAGPRLLNADPTVIYAKDTIELRGRPFTDWPLYLFWSYEGIGEIAAFRVPPDLSGYHTWHSVGLPPGPIASPSLASIRAALEPDTKEGYLYFVLKPDGSGEHAFARTLEEHQRNVQLYRNRPASSPGVSPDASPETEPENNTPEPSPSA